MAARKYDGHRFQRHFNNGQPRFYTRRGHDWSDRVNSLVLAAGQRSAKLRRDGPMRAVAASEFRSRGRALNNSR
jgi:ATP-dependent DNA ligase